MSDQVDGGGPSGEDGPAAVGAVGGAANPATVLPRSARFGSIGAVWIAAVVFAVLIGTLSKPALYATWISLALAVCVLIGLIAQLATQQKDGFVNRLAGSVSGAFVILGLTGAVLAVVAATR